jgi:hypothetical protein
MIENLENSRQAGLELARRQERLADFKQRRQLADFRRVKVWPGTCLRHSWHGGLKCRRRGAPDEANLVPGVARVASWESLDAFLRSR